MEAMKKNNEASLSELRLENLKLQNQVDKLEYYQRKNNLKFYNLSEQKSENLDERVVSLCNKYLNPLQQLTDRSFERVHRLGAFQDGKRRAVILRVSNFKDKINILKLKKEMLEREKISMSEDFSKEVEVKRKKLYPVMSAIRSQLNQEEKGQVHLREDRLIVKGQSYTTETLDNLPKDISLKTLFTPGKRVLLPFLHNMVHCQTTVQVNLQ